MSDTPSSRRFMGGLLMAIGGLMAVLCGLCTGGFEIGFLSEGGFETGDYVLPLIFGVAPTLIGVGLFYVRPAHAAASVGAREVTDPSPVRRFIGGMLMAVGILIALLCGLCTGYFEVGFLSNGNDFSNLWLPLIVGGLPTLIGVGLFLLGRALFRRPLARPKIDEF